MLNVMKIVCENPENKPLDILPRHGITRVGKLFFEQFASESGI